MAVELKAVAASRTLNDEIEGSIAQASVMWLLHRRSDRVQDRCDSLERQIVQFSSAVFDAIGARYPMLRNEGRERLWFIYFKGLLIANTHPREEMVQAFRGIASKSGFGALLPPSIGTGENAKPNLSRISDAEALQQIARSLEQNNTRFET